MIRTLITSLGLTLVPCFTTAAQVARVPAVNDSIVVELVGQAIVEKSTHLFMRAAREGTPTSLEVTLPPGATSPQWQAFLDHLMRSLRGRDLLTPDNFRHVIDASSLVIGRDTIRAIIDVGLRSRCRGRWLSDGYSHALTWTRHGDSSAWIRVKPETVSAYNSVGCPIDS